MSSAAKGAGEARYYTVQIRISCYASRGGYSLISVFSFRDGLLFLVKLL